MSPWLFPDFQTLMLSLLKLASDGQQHTLAEAVERLALEFRFRGRSNAASSKRADTVVQSRRLDNDLSQESTFF